MSVPVSNCAEISVAPRKVRERTRRMPGHFHDGLLERSRDGQHHRPRRRAARVRDDDDARELERRIDAARQRLVGERAGHDQEGRQQEDRARLTARQSGLGSFRVDRDRRAFGQSVLAADDDPVARLDAARDFGSGVRVDSPSGDRVLVGLVVAPATITKRSPSSSTSAASGRNDDARSSARRRCRLAPWCRPPGPRVLTKASRTLPVERGGIDLRPPVVSTVAASTASSRPGTCT